MPKLTFRLDVTFDDQTGNPRAAYLRVRDGVVAETRELDDRGRANADFNADGELLGLEFLAPVSIRDLDKLTANEEPRVQEFFRNSAPRQLVTA